MDQKTQRDEAKKDLEKQAKKLQEYLMQST